MSRVVYFVQDVETGLIKIGYSGNFSARLSALKVMANNPLEVIFTHPGSFDLERRIHGILRQHRREGEWFEPHADLFALIEKLKAGEDFERSQRDEIAAKNVRDAEFEDRLRTTFSAVVVAAYGQEPGWAQRAANDAGVSAECVKNWVKKRSMPNGASLINFGRGCDLVRQWVRVTIASMFIAHRFGLSETQGLGLIAEHPRLMDIILESKSYDAAEVEVRKIIEEKVA